MQLTIEKLQSILDKRGGGVLKAGGHIPPNNKKSCEFCVEELRAYALGERWTDRPKGCTTIAAAARVLNDAAWSSNEVRTKHCLPLALLTDDSGPEGWVEQYIIRTVREILPIALRYIGQEELASNCEKAETLDDARKAAARAAPKVAASGMVAQAWKVATSKVVTAADVAVRTAWVVGAQKQESPKRDEILALGVKILIECASPSICH